MDIPDTFCGVPANKAAISALIPKGKSVRQDYDQGHFRAGCSLDVDDNVALDVLVTYWDQAPSKFRWSRFERPFKLVERDVSFSGAMKTGGDDALVRADCDKPDAYMTFDISISGNHLDELPSGYKKMQRFVDDLVPKETKKYHCTSAS